MIESSTDIEQLRRQEEVEEAARLFSAGPFGQTSEEGVA